METSTIERQPASKYLKQVAKVVNKKLTDREKAERLSNLPAPDEDDINAELIYFLTKSWGTSKKEHLSLLLDVGSILNDSQYGNRYRARYVWTGHYKQLSESHKSKPNKKELKETFSETLLPGELRELNKKAVTNFLKKKSKEYGELDHVDYRVYIINDTERPVLATIPEPVKIM